MAEVVDIYFALHSELGEMTQGLVVAEAGNQEWPAVDVGHVGSDDGHEDDVCHGASLEQIAIALDAHGQTIVLAFLKL